MLMEILRGLLYGFGLYIALVIAYFNTPLKRAQRARRRAQQERAAARERLHLDCQRLYHNALFGKLPNLRFNQDVLWIEYHTRLADPECEDPGRTPALLAPEQVEKDLVFILGSWRKAELLKPLKEH